jgi:hypothetical protein
LRAFSEKTWTHKIHVIEQHPLGLLVTLDVSRPQPGPFQAQFHFVRNGLDLAGIGPAAHYEVVGERSRPFFQFQYGDFFRLLFQAGTDGFGDL